MKHTAILFPWIGVLAAMIACAGCKPSRTEPIAEDVSSDPTPSPGTVNGGQEAPEPVLAEHWVLSETGRDYRERLLRDGSFWFFTDLVPTDVPKGGKIEWLSKPRAWWFYGDRVSPSELAALIDAIRALGLVVLPRDPPPQKETLMGATEAHWTYQLDGIRNEVVTFQGIHREPLERFEVLFDQAIYNAQMRWRRDRGLEAPAITPLPPP